jgi:hypothetical protein
MDGNCTTGVRVNHTGAGMNRTGKERVMAIDKLMELAMVGGAVLLLMVMIGVWVSLMFAVRTTCGPEIIEKRESGIIGENRRRVEMEI